DSSDCSLDLVYFDIRCRNLDSLIKEDLKILIQEFLFQGLDFRLLNESYRESRTKLAERSRVTCFTINPVSERMWNKHGGVHNGVCFQFDNTIEEKARFP